MADWALQTPVALLVFNRPETTERVFEQVRRARPPRLLVVADGPRADRPGEADRCRAARAVVERVDWPCVVETDYSETNLGCRRRVSSGLDWVFERVAEAIVLEDDCLPHPSFFRFCEELLDRYRDDERVMHISANNFEAFRTSVRAPSRLTLMRRRVRGPRGASYYFSRYPHVWGWASWRRAWAHYDVEMTAWREAPDRERYLEDITSPGERSMWADAWDRALRGEIDTWDYQWSFACRSNGGLSAMPRRNLVSNIGFGPGALHTTDARHPLAALPIEGLKFPLRPPDSVSRDAAADSHTAFLHFGAPAPGDGSSLLSPREAAGPGSEFAA